MLQTFQVFIVSGNVIKIYAEGGLVYAVHGLGTEVLYWAIAFFATSCGSECHFCYGDT
jgi:hypothetical protein